MSKEVLLFPGRNCTFDTVPFNRVLDLYGSLGHRPHFVDIDWTTITIDSVVEQVEAAYNQYDSEDTILAGFSLGGLAAFVAAGKRSPAAVWALSPAAFYKEDLTPEAVEYLKSYGTTDQEIASYQKLSFEDTMRAIKCNVQLFIGEHELPGIRSRSEQTFEHLHPNAALTDIAGGNHDPTEEPYLQAMQVQLSTLAL